MKRLICAAYIIAASMACSEPKQSNTETATVSPEAPEEKQPLVLLITSDELAESWQAFADWKKSIGKPVQIVTTGQIAAKFEGPDIQEKIRLCVREQIDKHGVKWVILGGDSLLGGKGIVPHRNSVHTTMWGSEDDIPTDIYYISPTNWDADGDGIYGEFKDDRAAISYPDGSVGLGRIPVRTAADVSAYTGKVIAYESHHPGEKFSNQMVYTCTVEAAYPKVLRSWDDHVSTALGKGTVERWFSDKSLPGRGQFQDKDLIPANWIELLNQKRVGKFHFHGHGLINGWVLDDDTMFTAEHVAKLTNKDAYPIITTVSCFTGHFDAKEDPCIAESMLRQENAGAIAMVAPCREGKPHFSNPRRDFPLMVNEGKMDGTTNTMTQFWAKGVTGKLSLGYAIMAAKQSMADQALTSAEMHMCLVELNFLGDPTLDFQP
jgi:hypothetical protein